MPQCVLVYCRFKSGCYYCHVKRALLYISILVTIAACKTSKPATYQSEKGSSHVEEQKELSKLSTQLSLDLSTEDDLELYAFVADWLGVPHKNGGCEKSGTDCSCFVRMAYEQTYHKKLPRSSAEMFKHTERIDTDSLREGDLVFFKIKSSHISHVGIYLKDNWFAHVSSSKGVMINNLNEKYYRSYFAGAGRVN